MRRVLSVAVGANSHLKRRDPGVLLLIPGVNRIVRQIAGSWPPSEHQRITSRFESPTHSPNQVSVVLSSRGNHFFAPIAESLAEAFARAGFAAEVIYDFAQPGTIPVIVAPHEYFALTEPEAYELLDLSETILLNTEQPHTRWFGASWPYLRHAKFVLDMNQEAAQFSKLFGVHSTFIPLRPCEADPQNSSILETELESVTGAVGPFDLSWADRPIDVLFVGSLSRRREAVLSSLAPTLAEFRTSVRLAEARQPLTTDSPALTTTAEFIQLARQSKVLLNIHRDQHRYFEWQRLVMVGMANGCLVISDATPDSGVFRAGEHYVESEVHGLPGLLTFYLSEKSSIPLAEQMIDRAQRRIETIDTSMLLQTILKGTRKLR